MATRKHRRLGSKGGARFVKLYHWLLQSHAWRSASLAARCLLIEVWRRHNGVNNGEIAFSVREAAEALGIGKNTANRAFRELEDKGFLNARERGSFHWKGGPATTWELTAEPLGERPASKEFMRRQPEIQNPVPERGTTGPLQRDRDTLTTAQTTPKTPPTVPRRGTNTPRHGPPERDTSIIPGRGGENAAAVPEPAQLDHLSDVIVREGQTFDLTLPAFLDRRRGTARVH